MRLPLLMLTLPVLVAQAPAQRFSFSAGEADLRDILRVAAKDAQVNLTFEPGLDTRVRGLELRDVTLDEILKQVLPAYGLDSTRQDRTIHIHRADGGVRFHSVDFLSLRRMGSKTFSVNASGQVMQGGGGGQGGQSGGMGGSGGGQGSGQGGGQGQGGGNSAAFASSLMAGSGSDPWSDLRTGLSLLVFGEVLQAKEAQPQSMGSGGAANIQGPQSVGYSKDGRTLLIQPDAGLVAVGAEPAVQRRVEGYLAEMKKRYRRQVLLEARIVEVTLGKDTQLGTDWNAVLKAGSAAGGTGSNLTGTLDSGPVGNAQVDPSQGLFKLVSAATRVNATISALARDGRLQVLSHPRLSTLNNQKAILRVVREEAYFLQNSQISPGGTTGNIATVQVTPMVVPVGIILDIQPQISEDGTITLAVNPSVSEVAAVRTFTATGASASLPVVDRRDLDTVVRLREGETLVLAGIIRTKEVKDDKGVPWFRKLPVFGYLFSRKEESRQRTELAIFITPTLIEDPDQIGRETKTTEARMKEAQQEPTGLKRIEK